MIELSTTGTPFERGINLFPKDAARFWSKVDKMGPAHPHDPNAGNCWIWTAARQKSGYGVMMFRNKRTVGTHRISFFLEHGVIDSSLHVLHGCGRPYCVRPDHLRQGTDKENTQDTIAHGRMSRGQRHSTILKRVCHRGEANHTSKLTEAQVHQIRAAYDLKRYSLPQIAAMFGIKHVCVWQIGHRKTWTHLPEMKPEGSATA